MFRLNLLAVLRCLSCGTDEAFFIRKKSHIVALYTLTWGEISTSVSSRAMVKNRQHNCSCVVIKRGAVRSSYIYVVSSQTSKWPCLCPVVSTSSSGGIIWKKMDTIGLLNMQEMEKRL